MSALAITMASCDHPVFEYEEDCGVVYGLNFVYDMNLDWADAFPTLVNTLELYAFDSEGVFVKEYTLTQSEISIPGYTMILDLEPGAYTLVAWAGLETGIDMSKAYTIPAMTPGVSTLNDLTCTINTSSNADYPSYTDLRLPFLYQGTLGVSLPDSPPYKAEYHYTMYLTKDTNHVRAMIQKVDGDVTTEDVDLIMSASNKEMAWDNELMGNENVTYLPYFLTDDEITYPASNGETDTYQGIIADFMTGRFTPNMPNGVTLTIYNIETGEPIFRVPVINYALMAQSYYEEAYGKTMTHQEFLDRQSEYFMTFFLDENLHLLYTEIQILEWRVVIKNYDVDS